MTEKYKKVRLGEITSAEAAQIFKRNAVVLLPVASHESHGPQTPMGDYLACEKIAELIAHRATDEGTETVVAPVLPFGGANFFGGTPGGIAISQSTLTLVLAEMLENFLRHGIKRLIFINGHNGNVEPIHNVTLDIYRKQKVMIPSFYIWQMCAPAIQKLHGAEKVKKLRGHGSDPVMGVHWHLWPERMRLDLIPDPQPAPEVMGLKVSGFGKVFFETGDIGVPIETDQIAPNGVWKCDPRLAAQETGKVVIEELTTVGAKFVHHFTRQAP
jgi:creatinine amidohydrolase